MNYNTPGRSGQSFDSNFNILDYVHRLEKSKKRNKYVCPICGGNDLSISKDGKYDCYDCHKTKEIASYLTAPEREHRKWQQELDRRLIENVQNKRREQIQEKYPDFYSEADIDKVIEIEEGIKEGTRSHLPGERLRLMIEGWSLETDPLSKVVMKTAIMRRFGISQADFDAAVIEVSRYASVAELEFYEAEDFLSAEFRTKSFLVQGVPIGGVTVLGGEYGSGKSTLAYWLALSVLTGQKFLTDSPSQTGGVLIVNSDEGRADSQERMIDMCFPNKGWGYFARFKIDNHWHDLEDRVRQDKPKLIIVDSFCGIHGRSFDENSSLSGLTIERFNNLAETYGCAVVVLHHTNKQGKLRGSSRILDIAHSVLLVDKQPASRILRSEKVRGVEPFELEFGLTEEGEIKLLRNKTKSQVPETIYDRVLQLLYANTHTRLEVRDICSALSLGKQQALDALKRMKANGKAKQYPGTRDKRAKVWAACVLQENVRPHTPPLIQNDSYNFAETTTEHSLEPSEKCKSDYKTLTNEDPATLINSEETLIISNPSNSSQEGTHSEIVRPDVGVTPIREGEDTTDNPVLHNSGNDFPTVSWVIYKEEKWNVIEQYQDFLTLTPYGKVSGSPVYCRAVDCDHIEFRK